MTKLDLDTERILLAEATAHVVSGYRIMSDLTRRTRKDSYRLIREGLYVVEEACTRAQLQPVNIRRSKAKRTVRSKKGIGKSRARRQPDGIPGEDQ